MTQEKRFNPERLKAPKAAAIAGILFSVLLMVSVVLLLISVPENIRDGGEWISGSKNTLFLALNLVPFAGIAFLWFMGVVRDRLGEYEDRFIATVFLGSGFLFLGMLFSSAAMAGSVILLYLDESNRELASDFYTFGYSTAREIINTYGMKMAGVFMISTCTLFIRSLVIPRWMALLGYGLAAVMILRTSQIHQIGWVFLVFPLWVLLISIYILIDNFWKKAGADSL